MFHGSKPFAPHTIKVLSAKGISTMTMNKSLRVRKGGGGSRGVLSRAERITKLKNLEKWEDGQSPLGLPKVRVYKISMKKKKAKDDSETAEGE